MKRLACLAGAVFFVFGAMAEAEFRDFMDTQGRSIRGRVVRFDAKSQIVTFERDNKAIVKVSLSTFSEADQKYVKEWALSREFLTESKFKIEAKRKAVDDKDKSEKWTYEDKDVENRSYEIIFENRMETAVKNLEVEYCIFYEQEVYKAGGKDCQQGVLCGNKPVASIEPKSEVVVISEPVTIYKYELSADAYYVSGAANVLRGDVHGIWVRARVTLPSGEKLIREYCLPESLRNSKAWTTTSVAAGENKVAKSKRNK